MRGIIFEKQIDGFFLQHLMGTYRIGTGALNNQVGQFLCELFNHIPGKGFVVDD
jgi:hypothetical protein